MPEVRWRYVSHQWVFLNLNIRPRMVQNQRPFKMERWTALEFYETHCSKRANQCKILCGLLRRSGLEQHASKRGAGRISDVEHAHALETSKDLVQRSHLEGRHAEPGEKQDRAEK